MERPHRPTDTLVADAATLVAPQPVSVDVSLTAPEPPGFADRYCIQGRLGEGGMGEVELCRDARIGRDVAMKLLRDVPRGAESMRARFVREARVQGQLEHPAIAPVYDLGITPDGRAFFTMKRVRGMTLEQVLALLAAGDAPTAAAFGLRRLLSAFATVCLAIDYAHSRGAVHRDLKPANIMLGEFGEVTVLDWGIAKVLSAPDDDVLAAPTANAREPLVTPSPEDALRTRAGALLGTPGYMAPEQAVATDVEARADVYALGAILFEILTLEPLHRGASIFEIVDSTLHGVERHASVRAPGRDVPPELELICVDATERDRDRRTRTARELADAVQGFLDGDRDLERRRELARQHAARARDEASLALGGAPDAVERRGCAMREAGRALALDPESLIARQALLELLTRPPSIAPDEVERGLAASAQRGARVAARAAMGSSAAMLALAALALRMGFRDWNAAVACVAWILAAAGLNLVILRQERPRSRLMLVQAFVAAGIVAALSRLFGPLVLAPSMALGLAVATILHPYRAGRLWIIVITCSGFLVPLLLEELGVWRASYVFTGGRMCIEPHLASFPRGPTLGFLALATTLTVISTCIYVAGLREDLARAERQLHLHAWQLGQLIGHDR